MIQAFASHADETALYLYYNGGLRMNASTDGPAANTRSCSIPDRNLFPRLRPGDRVLFSPPGTESVQFLDRCLDDITYSGQVISSISSAETRQYACRLAVHCLRRHLS